MTDVSHLSVIVSVHGKDDIGFRASDLSPAIQNLTIPEIAEWVYRWFSTSTEWSCHEHCFFGIMRNGVHWTFVGEYGKVRAVGGGVKIKDGP